MMECLIFVSMQHQDEKFTDKWGFDCKFSQTDNLEEAIKTLKKTNTVWDAAQIVDIKTLKVIKRALKIKGAWYFSDV